MKRFVLTKFDKGIPSSKSYVDASEAVRDWAKFSGKEDGFKDWHEAFMKYKRLSYFNDTQMRYAFVTELEVF